MSETSLDKQIEDQRAKVSASLGILPYPLCVLQGGFDALTRLSQSVHKAYLFNWRERNVPHAYHIEIFAHCWWLKGDKDPQTTYATLAVSPMESRKRKTAFEPDIQALHSYLMDYIQDYKKDFALDQVQAVFGILEKLCEGCVQLSRARITDGVIIFPFALRGSELTVTLMYDHRVTRQYWESAFTVMDYPVPG